MTCTCRREPDGSEFTCAECDRANDAPDYDDFEPPGKLCPRCDGAGWLNCYCGGDLCVCMNYGEYECPRCDGSGYV